MTSKSTDISVRTNLFPYLKKSIHRGIIFEYWVDEKKRIGYDQVGMIDWTTHVKARGVM